MSINNENKIAVILTGLLIFILVTSAIGGEELIRFPGEITEIISPSGKYVLYNVDNEKGEHNHILFLKENKKEKDIELYSYKRYVEILWSPIGNSLIINDHGGSDYTNSIIFILDGERKMIDIGKELKKKLGDNKSIFGNHHVYIEGIKWIDENKLKVKIYGYGDIDPDGFALLYEYTIEDGFSLIERKSNYQRNK